MGGWEIEIFTSLYENDSLLKRHGLWGFFNQNRLIDNKDNFIDRFNFWDEVVYSVG